MFFKHEVDDSRYQKSVHSTSLLPTIHGLVEGPLFDLKMIFFLFLSGKLQDLTSIAYGRINLIGTICCWEPKNSEGTVKRGKTVEKNRFKKMIWTRIFLEKPIKCIPTDSYLLVRYGNLGKFFYLGKIITNNFTRVKKFTQVPVPNY